MGDDSSGTATTATTTHTTGRSPVANSTLHEKDDDTAVKRGRRKSWSPLSFATPATGASSSSPSQSPSQTPSPSPSAALRRDSPGQQSLESTPTRTSTPKKEHQHHHHHRSSSTTHTNVNNPADTQSPTQAPQTQTQTQSTSHARECHTVAYRSSHHSRARLSEIGGALSPTGINPTSGTPTILDLKDFYAPPVHSTAAQDKAIEQPPTPQSTHHESTTPGQPDKKAKKHEKLETLDLSFDMALNACLSIFGGGLGLKPSDLPTSATSDTPVVCSNCSPAFENYKQQMQALKTKDKERDLVVSELVTLVTDLLSALPLETASNFNVRLGSILRKSQSLAQNPLISSQLSAQIPPASAPRRKPRTASVPPSRSSSRSALTPPPPLHESTSKHVFTPKPMPSRSRTTDQSEPKCAPDAEDEPEPLIEEPDVNLLVDEGKRKSRQEAAFEELLSTETIYLKNLEVLLNVFLKPMKSLPESMCPEETHSISFPFSPFFPRNTLNCYKTFSTIEIIKNYNTIFLAQLNSAVAKCPTAPALGPVFMGICAFLKVYTLWVSTYERACTTMGLLSQNPEFASWLQKQQQTAGMDIFSFLILPVQRIPRYVMLLEQLVKYADKSQSDYQQLTESYEQMKSVASHINEKKRDAEAMLKVRDIEELIVGKFVDPVAPDKPLVQPQRRFLHQGAVMLKKEKGLIPRYLFLFNDIIVETHPVSKKSFIFNKTGGHDVYKFVDSASLIHSSVNEQSELTFQLQTDNKRFCVACSSPAQKTEWVTKLKQASCWVHQVNELGGSTTSTSNS